MSIILKKITIWSQTHLISRTLSTTNTLYTKEWRVQRGLSVNRTAEGILTDGPDFTYLDGRPTPLLQKQKKRILKHREVASKIVELCSELEFAKVRHQTIEAAKEQERQQIIANRLKPKGTVMFQKKK